MAIIDLFRGGKPLHIAPPLVGVAPPPVTREQRPGGFSERLRACIAQSGMTQDEFAMALSTELKKPVSRSRLASWLNSNATPRISEEQVFGACDAVIAQSDGTPQLVKGSEAAAVIKLYLDLGLTRRALTVAGEVPQSTLSQWEAGRADVRARPWHRFVALVDAHIEALKRTGTL